MSSRICRIVLFASIAGCCFGSMVLAQGAKPAEALKPVAANHAVTAPVEGVYNPVADLKAVVTVGTARFTVLTPQLIRMEWAADGKFEDHASFVFLNRRLAVPKFEKALAVDGRLTLKTDAVTLNYAPASDGKFTADNLSITLKVGGSPRSSCRCFS